jgi:hypothetical protein
MYPYRTGALNIPGAPGVPDTIQQSATLSEGNHKQIIFFQQTIRLIRETEWPQKELWASK